MAKLEVRPSEENIHNRPAGVRFPHSSCSRKVIITSDKTYGNTKRFIARLLPGVAVPVEEIARDPDLVYDYTSKGNMVAVISNGTAILG